MTMRNQGAENWYSNLDELVNMEYDYDVVMKDTTIHAHSMIYVDIPLHKSYLVYVDKTVAKNNPRRNLKVYPDQTVKVTRKDGSNIVVGNPTDSCWLFKVVRGKINLYSQLSQTKGLDDSYIKAYQVGESGPVVKIDSASLADIVRNDVKASKLVSKKSYYQAILTYNGK